MPDAPGSAVREDPIVIVPADPDWARAFKDQARRVGPVLAPWLARPIEHIGSTAVADLPAKPIIDMLAVVVDRDAVTEGFPALADLGWVAAPEPGDEGARRWSWCFPDLAHRTHHLHVVEERSSGWPDWLLFRDFLRTSAPARADYARVKVELAAADPYDRIRYRAGKAPTIRALLERAERRRP